MKRTMLVVLFILFLFSPELVKAADVYVLDEDNYGGPIGGFYSGLYGGPGSTASYISGELTADKLTAGRLLWLIPADDFTPSEISVMSSFLSGGGRIGFLGAWYGFATARDNSINAAISSLGGHISINTNYVDNGYPHYAYRANNHVLSDPLTNGVDSFVYGIFSPLGLSGSAKALVLGEDGSSVLLAYENIGAGTVFVMGGQSAWDLDPFSAGTDNRDLFTNMLYADTNVSSLYASFTGAGVYRYDGTSWSQTTPNTPETMVVSGSTLYGDFGSSGIWMYNGTSWGQATPSNPQMMTISGSTLYGAFSGAGIWMYNGTSWSQTTPSNPEAILVSGSNLYGDFGSSGIWMYNGTSWSQTTPSDPQMMTISGSTLYGAFSGAGIWMYNGTSWSQTTPSNPEAILVSGSTLYGDFGSSGIWMYNGTSWSQLSPLNLEQMVCTATDLYADFGSSGIWKWDGSAWSQVTPNDPTDMVGN